MGWRISGCWGECRGRRGRWCMCRCWRISRRWGDCRRRRWDGRGGRRRRISGGWGERSRRSGRRGWRRFYVYVFGLGPGAVLQFPGVQFQIGGHAVEVFVASDYASVGVLGRAREKRLGSAMSKCHVLEEKFVFILAKPSLQIVAGHARNGSPGQLYLRVARRERCLEV